MVAGRRKALFAAVTTSLVFGVASALAPDYWWYAVLRAGTGECYHALNHRLLGLEAAFEASKQSCHVMCAHCRLWQQWHRHHLLRAGG